MSKIKKILISCFIILSSFVFLSSPVSALESTPWDSSAYPYYFCTSFKFTSLPSNSVTQSSSCYVSVQPFVTYTQNGYYYFGRPNGEIIKYDFTYGFGTLKSYAVMTSGNQFTGYSGYLFGSLSGSSSQSTYTASTTAVYLSHDYVLNGTTVFPRLLIVDPVREAKKVGLAGLMVTFSQTLLTVLPVGLVLLSAILAIFLLLRLRHWVM